MKRCVFAILCGLAVLIGPGPVAAQVRIDPASVVALAEAPWRDRQAFVTALEGVLDGLQVEMGRLPDALRADDPFLWSVMGRFGAPLAGVATPGGIVACARYGVATRDRLAGRDLSDPGAFALFGATQPAVDDAAVWPEAAVARLSCLITWDDTRRVEILPEAAARAALELRFARVERWGDREALGADWASLPPRYGAQGYGLLARDGRADSVAEVESLRIELRVGHQQIRFRSFLMNGGM